MRQDFREAAALALLGAHVKLLALIDVEEEGRRLGLVQFLVAALGRVEQIAQGWLLADRAAIDPFVLLLDARRDRSRRTARSKERLDQSLERLGARLEREKAPAAAVVERPPAKRRALAGLGPCLAHAGREHARLRERGFADAGIAEQDGQLVGRRCERLDHLDCLAPLPKKKSLSASVMAARPR